MTEPDWLLWAREVQSHAQTGLAFVRDPYDRQRYEALRELAARMMASGAGVEPGALAEIFAAQAGYATPKLGVRAAVFDDAGRVLLVREAEDGDRWTLPGGWAEQSQTAGQSAAREVLEESGYIVRPTKLAAAWDKAAQGIVPGPFSITTLFFVCDLLGGEPRTSVETTGVGWFAEDELPTDLSPRRTTPRQLARMFAHRRDPSLPTEWD